MRKKQAASIYEPPENLHLEARLVWDKIAPIVNQGGGLAFAFQASVVMLCETWMVYLRLQKDFAILKTPKGKAENRRMSAKYWGLICTLCRQFYCVPINKTRAEVAIRPMKGKRERGVDWSEKP